MSNFAKILTEPKSPSKPSRPARAYLHLVKKDDVVPLGETVRNATWEDAKNTFTSPALVAPPALEMSIYKKVPGNKKRTDTRQGTIDQDPEFMTFLEALANPAPLRESIDVEGPEDTSNQTKVTTTPLVEYLKEKKANKSKESGKKRGEKSKGKDKDDDASKKKGKESKLEKADKADKGKDSVKILTKKTATEQATEAAKNAAKEINAAIAQDAPKNRRAGIAAAARILQRDLGLSPGTAHRRARQDAAKAEADSQSATAKEAKESPSQSPEPSAQDNKPKQSPAGGGKAQAAGKKTRGGKSAEKAKPEPIPQPTATNPPVILKKKPDTSNAPAAPVAPAEPAETSQKAATTKEKQADKGEKQAGKENGKGSSGKGAAAAQKKGTNVVPDATRAFIKQAVQSQGVTEAALRQVLEGFGTITAIEMDKRKSFAYVDFADHDSLVKAIAASPVTVAQGSVQVLERREKKPAANAPANTAGAAGAETEKNEKAEKGEKKDKAKEKSSGRGRRGRGKGNAKENGEAGCAAPPTESPAPTPAAPTGSG